MNKGKKSFEKNLREITGLLGKGQLLGGGTAAGLAGLIAIGLLDKVVGYAEISTDKRKEFFGQLEQAKRELTDLSWVDGEVFAKFMADQNDPVHRVSICEIPLKIARIQLGLMETALWLADNGNPKLASDALVAQELIQAGFFGGLEMVRGNLCNLNKEDKDSFLKRIDRAINKFGQINDEIGSVAN